MYFKIGCAWVTGTGGPCANSELPGPVCMCRLELPCQERASLGVLRVEPGMVPGEIPVTGCLPFARLGTLAATVGLHETLGSSGSGFCARGPLLLYAPAMANAFVTQGSAALQWYVAVASAYIPAGVVAGGGTIQSPQVVQAGVTCVQGGAADPLFAGYPGLFAPLAVVPGA